MARWGRSFPIRAHFFPAILGPIKFDAASNSGYQASLSTYNWSHTTTGTNRGLLVTVSIFATGSVSSITYGGTNLTFIRADTVGVYRNEIWALGNPTSGANTVQVNLSASLTSIASVVSYTGVDSNMIESHAGATGTGATSPTVSLTTLSDNAWVVDGLTTSDTTMAPTTPQRQRDNNTGALGTGGMSDKGNISPVGSATMSWGATGSLDSWAIGAVALNPVNETFTTTQIIMGLARITATTLKTLAGKARITNTTTQTLTGKSSITVATTRTLAGLSRITATTTKTLTGLARVTAATTKTLTGKSRVTITTTQTISGKSRVQITTTQILTGLARITAVATKTLTGLARITSTTTQTVTGKSRIQVATTKTLTGQSRVTVTTLQVISGLARITVTTSKVLTGLARITNTTVQTINGKSRIQVATSQTITGKSSIAGGFVTTLQTLTGKSRVTATSTKTIIGRAKILSTVPPPLPNIIYLTDGEIAYLIASGTLPIYQPL